MLASSTGVAFTDLYASDCLFAASSSQQHDLGTCSEKQFTSAHDCRKICHAANPREVQFLMSADQGVQDSAWVPGLRERVMAVGQFNIQACAVSGALLVVLKMRRKVSAD